MLVNTDFMNNTSIFEGGALVMFSGQGEILKCRFITNSAFLGGVMVVAMSKVAIHDSYFYLNFVYVPNIGGLNNESVISINKRLLHKDIDGGVLLACKLTNLTITESIFHNNSAQLNGGVVAMGQACGLVILQYHFDYNKASRGGVVLQMVSLM